MDEHVANTYHDESYEILSLVCAHEAETNAGGKMQVEGKPNSGESNCSLSETEEEHIKEVNIPLTITDTRLGWEALRRGKIFDMEQLPRETVKFGGNNETDTLNDVLYTRAPFQIPRHREEEIRNEDFCAICGVYTYGTALPCRVCVRVYHVGCLRSSGRSKSADSVLKLGRKLVDTWWSCYHCDDLADLLSDKEMLTVTQMFDHCNTNQDSTVTLEGYISYKRKMFKLQTGENLPQAEEEDEVFRFKHMSRHDEISLQVSWWVFLNYEAINILRSRPKAELIKMLTPKEIQLAKETFRFLDRDGNGVISQTEAAEAYGIWYKNFYEDSPHDRAILDCHTKTNALILMDADKDYNGILLIWDKMAHFLTSPRETRRQEDRMKKISGLEDKLRKKHILNCVQKTIVDDLYSPTNRKGVRKSNGSVIPSITVASPCILDDSNADDFTGEEDMQNLKQYMASRRSCQDGEVGASTPSEEERRGSSGTTGRRPSTKGESDIIERWETNYKGADNMNLSPCNFLKIGNGSLSRRKSMSDNSMLKTNSNSALELLNKSCEALNSLKDGLEPGDRRPSSAKHRRPSLYMMTETEANIWRHCQRSQRRKSSSSENINMDGVDRCRYLRVPSRCQDQVHKITDTQSSTPQ